MSEFVVKPLDPSTWPAYADLIERHNGVWGGCWCMGFQKDEKPKYESAAEKKEDKRSLICKGRAHAAVVFDGDLAVGWCQYGRSDEIEPRNQSCIGGRVAVHRGGGRRVCRGVSGGYDGSEGEQHVHLPGHHGDVRA